MSIWVLLASGTLAGAFAGMFGLGGGRVIMPVLLGALCLGVKRSVGTSSFIILLSLAGSWFGSTAMHGEAKHARVNAPGLHEFLDWAQEIGACP